MLSRWSDEQAAAAVTRYGPLWGEELALRTYTSRLLGSEPRLVLHGGGNSSCKATVVDVLGRKRPAVFVKASGWDMALIEPPGHPALDLDYLKQLRALAELDDDTMVNELRGHLFRADSPTPSIETLVHAFLPPRFIDHTHADAILALTNQPDGRKLIQNALGGDVIFAEYVTPGFKLAKISADLFEANPGARAMVWSHHGLVTWGQTARVSYDAMIDLTSRAEAFLANGAATGRPARSFSLRGKKAETDGGSGEKTAVVTPEDVQDRIAQVAPIVRGLLAQGFGDGKEFCKRVVVQPITTPEILEVLSRPWAEKLLVSPPLTSDHLIRTKPLPLWLDEPAFDDFGTLRGQLKKAIAGYREKYRAYLERNKALVPAGVGLFDDLPRVVLVPGLGALCAGLDVTESTIVRDITEHTIRTKGAIDSMNGSYQGLPERELFRMEYRTLQHAKLHGAPRVRGSGAAAARAAAVGASDAAGEAAAQDEPEVPASLRGHVALVTGGAGAIGAGICQGLLAAGCAVAVTDLPGDALDSLVADLTGRFGSSSVVAVPLDVTDAASVKEAFCKVSARWGGIDLVVATAGIAAVAGLNELELDRFRKLEQVNVEGTLLVLAEAGKHFKTQGSGGDIVLVSTKNVFSPGAGFGAYSATKAAAHQLARIASLEFAADDVRVNMVSPDAVFSHGARRSGLWAEVGPDRMRARGLDEEGLEAYYRSRNLLKTAVTARHVANAVLFFATRQTPTTGATIPVDGGLPDATPR